MKRESHIYRASFIHQFISSPLPLSSPQPHPPNLDLKKPFSALDQPPRPLFGVNFDLTASYSSSAICFPNVTTITPASESYTSALLHPSLSSSQHPSPSYNSISSSYSSMPRQFLRKTRKAINLPSSPYVMCTSRTCSLPSTRAVVDERLVEPITSAGVTAMITSWRSTTRIHLLRSSM